MMAKLELGAGYSPTPGFMTLDLNPKTSPTFLGSAYPLPTTVLQYAMANEPFDELRAVDVLEHISYRDTIETLRGWREIVDVGARLYVQVPDAGRCVEWWMGRDPERLVDRLPSDLPQDQIIGLAWRLLGGHADGQMVREGDDWRLNAHYALFTERWLRICLTAAQWMMVECKTNAHPNLCCWAVAI